MTSVYDRIAEARRRLELAGLLPADAAIDAEVLARHSLGWDRARLVTDGRGPVPAGFDERYTADIDRRVVREPVAFMTRHREFWGLDFEVTPDVLVPRPESELIVESVCDEVSAREHVKWIVDVGTGSGCLAVALAQEFPAARIMATDLSLTALAVAKRNARAHANGRVALVQSNLLNAVAGPVDLIVANPPYVPSNARLAPDVGHYEPSIALYGGTDGLMLLERLIGEVRARLAAGGLFVMEFGFDQDARVTEFAFSAGWRDVTIKEDLQGIPRVAVMRNHA